MDDQRSAPPDANAAPRLVAVGDLQLGDSPTAVGFGFRSAFPDPSDMATWASEVRDILGPADVTFGNLEGVISEAGLVPHQWRSCQLRGRPFYARYLREAGFTVLNVANNHSFQHGRKAFDETVRVLRESGIEVAGVQGAPPWSSEPVVLDSAGRRLGFLAYSFRPRQYANEPPPYAEAEPSAICGDVERLRDEVDTVIVSLHWGEEFVTTPSEEEVSIAERILDVGAALIIGHHPHVLRPLQQIGDGVVAYSLGNFTGDMVWHEPLRTGGILRCGIADVPIDARIEEIRVEGSYLPRPTGRRIEPVSQVEALAAGPYADAIEKTIGAQRRDAYRYAALNLYRFPPRILFQLALTTLRNKLAAVTASE